MEFNSRNGRSRPRMAGAIMLTGLGLLAEPAMAQDTIDLGPIDVYTRIRTRAAPGPASTTVSAPSRPSPTPAPTPPAPVELDRGDRRRRRLEFGDHVG